jgi:hypothetical protein
VLTVAMPKPLAMRLAFSTPAREMGIPMAAKPILISVPYWSRMKSIIAMLSWTEENAVEQNSSGVAGGMVSVGQTEPAKKGTGTPALVASAMMGDTLALTISTAPSWLRRRRTFEAARAGWPWSSRITSWTWRLLMPPLALRLSTYIFMPLACPA